MSGGDADRAPAPAPVAEGAAGAARAGGGWRARLGGLARIHPIYIVLIALLVAIAWMSPVFAEPAGMMNFLRRAAPLMILAAGQVFVIVAGGFDLAVGSLVTLVVLGSALMIDGDPTMTGITLAVMVGVGVAVGLVNGAIVAYLKVPSIIATLGMLISLKGVALSLSGGSPQGYLPENFRFFGRHTFTDIPLIGILPVAVIVLVVFGALAIWLMHGTRFGKQVLALGDNPRAAELAGVNVPVVRIGAFLISALSAVVAGVLLGGFAGVSTDVGDGYELQAIAAAVIGGAQLLGGRGSVPTAIAGALTLSALFTLLNLLGFPKPLRDAVQGLILIAAVAYTMAQRHRRG
ncbi:MAG: ABC transporter permease [Azospirillaceae bacterium]